MSSTSPLSGLSETSGISTSAGDESGGGDVAGIDSVLIAPVLTVGPVISSSGAGTEVLSISAGDPALIDADAVAPSLPATALSISTISAGVIPDAASPAVVSGTTLTGATYLGPLVLTGNYQSLFIEGGLTLLAADGTSPGSIDLSAAGYSGISILDSETLDNATLNLAGYSNSLTSGTGNDSGNTLTLGNGFTIDVSGGSGYLGQQEWAFYANDSGDTLINAGTINVSAGGLYVYYGTFDNIGSIGISGGVLDVVVGTTLDNTGGISVSGGVLDVASGATFDNTGSITVSGAGVLEINGLFNNDGGTVTLATPTSGDSLYVDGGTFAGGVIQGSGPTATFQNGTLSGITYQGTLALAGSNYQSLFIEGGLTLLAADGTSPGSIDLSAAGYSGVSILDSETLDNATLNFGGSYANSLTSGSGNDSGNTLTLGNGFTIDVNGGSDYLGLQEWAFYANDSGDTLINAGTINVSAGGLYVYYGTFDNTGSIDISGGLLGIVSGTTLDNTGSISVSGGVLDVASGAILNNTGSITVSGGTLEIASGATLQGLNGISLSGGGSLILDGVLDNTGETLDLGAGSVWGGLNFSTILGGTITDGGQGLTQSGTFEGVTVLSGLTVNGAYLTLGGGSTVPGAGGAAPGTVSAIAGGAIEWQGSTDLTASVVLANSTLELTSSPTGTVTIDPGVLVDGYGTISDATYWATHSWWAYYQPGTIDNQGTIAADVAGQALTIDPPYLTNDGLITAGIGATLIIQSSPIYNYYESYRPQWSNAADGTIGGTDATIKLYGNFANAGLISAQGGALYLGQSGYTWQNTGTIDANGASIYLNGNGLTTGDIGAINRSGGSLTLQNGIDNSGGTIDLTSGTFRNLTLDGGTISNGTLIGGDLSVTGNPYNQIVNVAIAGGLTVGGGDLTLAGGTSVNGGITALSGVQLALSGYNDFTSSIDLLGGNVYDPMAPSGTGTVDAGALIDGYGGIYTYANF